MHSMKNRCWACTTFFLHHSLMYSLFRAGVVENIKKKLGQISPYYKCLVRNWGTGPFLPHPYPKLMLFVSSLWIFLVDLNHKSQAPKHHAPHLQENIDKIWTDHVVTKDSKRRSWGGRETRNNPWPSWGIAKLTWDLKNGGTETLYWGRFWGVQKSSQVFVYIPKHPNTCWEGVWDRLLGSKYLLRCLDV